MFFEIFYLVVSLFNFSIACLFLRELLRDWPNESPREGILYLLAGIVICGMISTIARSWEHYLLQLAFVTLFIAVLIYALVGAEIGHRKGAG
jgi:peptidoglycan/LPS O-acetylase OafA/YrhL